MARSIPALVKAPLLVWAREKAGLSVEGAAARANITIEKLQDWERGDQRPTIAELRNLGDVYKRPIAVFFLPEIPKGFDPQREFRRLPGLSATTESPEMRLALRRALYWREAAREIYEKIGNEIPVVSAAADITEEPERVGARIREFLGITWQRQLDWTSPSAALNAWRSTVEALGVLVFQTGGVNISEMRAISIPSGPLPVILLNNADSPHGRIFSLLHEFAHILLVNAGHRPSSMDQARAREDQILERTSNAFAAAALMPEPEFLKEALKYRHAISGDDTALLRFADRIKVSPEAILRRFVSLNRTPLRVYSAKRRDWQRRQWTPFEKGSWGPPIETRIVSAAGRAFVLLILQGYHRNAVSSSDVSDYLGIQLKYLDRVAQQLSVSPSSATAA